MSMYLREGLVMGERVPGGETLELYFVEHWDLQKAQRAFSVKISQPCLV